MRDRLQSSEFKRIRQKLSLTQSEFAALFGLSGTNAVSNIETGFRRPGRTLSVMLCLLDSLSKPDAQRLLSKLHSQTKKACDGVNKAIELPHDSLPQEDFRALFESAPGLYLILNPDFTIVEVNRAYTLATMTKRSDILGKGLFEIFPDNPDDPNADGARNVRASLNRVLKSKAPETMAIQKYDIRRPEAEGGGFEERFWSPINSPVLAPDGEVKYIIHRVEDVTEFVRLKRRDAEQALANTELRENVVRKEAEIFLRSRQLQELNEQLQRSENALRETNELLERKVQERTKSLAESKAQFQSLSDQMTQLAWIARGDGDVYWYNKRWYEYTGTTHDEMKGWGWQKLHHPDHVDRVVEFVKQAWLKPEPFELTFPLKSANGEYRWFLTRAVPLKGEDGSVIQWFGTNTDINDVREAQEQARKSEAQLKLVTSAIPDMIAYIDPEQRYRFVNPAYAITFGINSEDIIGKPMKVVLGDRAYALARPRVDAALHGEQVAFNTDIRKADASVRNFDVHYTPDKDTNGAIRGFVITARDVTYSALARKAVEESQAKLQEHLKLTKTITDNATSSLFMMDRLGHPTFMNPAAEKLTGYKLEEIKDKPLHYAIHYKKSDCSPFPMEECPIDNAQAELKPLQNQEEIFTDKQGRLFPVSYSVAPLERNDEVVGSVLEFRDISEQKKTENDLRKAKEDAERANELKSAFLANMSHEIRTPLGAMLGFADLLRDARLSPAERSSYTEILTRNGQQLAVIINDILDLSKVEAGQLALEQVEFDPLDLAEDVVSLFKVKALEKRLVLDFRRPEKPIDKVCSDPTRIRQVLMNLVGNAIKFTQHGHVSLSVEQRLKTGVLQIVYKIEDTGIGVPSDQRERIFQMFTQADNSMTRKFGGTGLGLALSSRLAQELGGTVKIEKSEPGRGSIFTFSFSDQRNPPASIIAQADSVPEFELKDGMLKDVKVLVVDDSSDNRELFWRYLTSFGASVEVAEDGWNGYKNAHNGSFDVVLMDIQMPVMDGYTATDKLRHQGYRKPIIALTAHAMAEVRSRCVAVGFTDHLSKPIKRNDLVSAVYRQAKASIEK